MRDTASKDLPQEERTPSRERGDKGCTQLRACAQGPTQHSTIHRSGRWPDLDPHEADQRCPQVSECTQNTLLRFLVGDESRTSGRLMPKCLQVRVCQSWSNITQIEPEYLTNLYLTAWETAPNEAIQNEAGTWLSVLKPLPFQWPSFVGLGQSLEAWSPC